MAYFRIGEDFALHPRGDRRNGHGVKAEVSTTVPMTSGIVRAAF